MDYSTSFNMFANAAADPEKTGILASLGIDWMLLAFQTIAFLILVVLLGKFVYPVFVRIIDERQEKIDAATNAAEQAEQTAAAAQEDVAKLLKEARKEASAIVATAKDEANAAIEASEKKAKSRAEKIVADAHDQIEKDVIAARKTLHNDTIDLVAMATEKIIGKTMTGAIDDKVIAAAVKEAK